jgi:translocation and assembly module TamB
VANVTLGVRTAIPWSLESVHATFVVAAPWIEWRDYVLERVNANGAIAGRVITVAPQGTAFGATVRARGEIRLPTGPTGATAIELTGIAEDVNLSRLPRSMGIPAAATQITSSFHVLVAVPRNHGPHIDAMTTWQSSTVAGATIADGSSVGFHVGAGDSRYLVDATVSDLDLQRFGEGFHLTGLASDRFRSNVNGRVMASVHGWDVDTMELHATGSLVDSSMFSGRVQATSFETTLAQGAMRVKAEGSVDHVDLAQVFDRSAVTGALSGKVEADVIFSHLSRGPGLDSVEGEVMADLGPSRIGRVDLDRALIAGSYHNAVVDVHDVEIAGSDVTVAGKGTLAVDGTDQSHLWIHVDAHKLETLGAWVQQPLVGKAIVDATIDGSRQELVVRGNVATDEVTYQRYGALTSTSTFEAKVPNFDLARTSFRAETQAAGLELAAVRLDRVTATTSYADRQIGFDITASQPARRVSAAGTLDWLPAAQEARLRRLKIDAKGQTWQTPRDHEVVVTHTPDALSVKSLQLVYGNQLITADGDVGLSTGVDSTLTVTLGNVDLGSVDVWLPRKLQTTGTLNAKALITGLITSPDVDADVQVRGGKVFEWPFESFDGHMTYGARGADVDLTFTESASRRLTARGHVPAQALRKSPSEDQFNLHVDSSDVDLGLMQGLVPSVSDLKGFLNANVDLTGTVDQPRATGAVQLREGAFRIASTGVSYTDLEGRIELLPDRFHIDDFHLLDNRKQQLSAKGDLRLTGLQPGEVTLSLVARDFTILDNQMGTLRVNSDLRLTGVLGKPRIEGDVNVSTGSLNLDPILSRLSSVSTTPIGANGGERQTEASRFSDWLPPQMSVHLVVPDRLLVKARDLAAWGPTGLGLGALNATLSGDLNVAAGPGKPMTLVGVVNTVRGFFDFQSRRFTILRDGSIRFQGNPADRLDPALNVAAERSIQAVTVRVNLRGRLQQPNIQLTSTPPLDQSDILALIIFNQPLNQLGESLQASLAQRAGAIAAGTLTSPLTSSIANALRLDQFNVNVTPNPGVAAELVVGQQIGPNLYVKVQQDIGDQTQTNVILEYEFTKWLRLQSNYVQGAIPEQQLFQHVQSTGLDLVLSFAFK